MGWMRGFFNLNLKFGPDGQSNPGPEECPWGTLDQLDYRPFGDESK
jgi:hypothetical protein